MTPAIMTEPPMSMGLLVLTFVFSILILNRRIPILIGTLIKKMKPQFVVPAKFKIALPKVGPIMVATPYTAPTRPKAFLFFLSENLSL